MAGASGAGALVVGAGADVAGDPASPIARRDSGDRVPDRKRDAALTVPACAARVAGADMGPGCGSIQRVVATGDLRDGAGSCPGPSLAGFAAAGPGLQAIARRAGVRGHHGGDSGERDAWGVGCWSWTDRCLRDRGGGGWSQPWTTRQRKYGSNPSQPLPRRGALEAASGCDHGGCTPAIRGDRRLAIHRRIDCPAIRAGSPGDRDSTCEG